MAPYAQAFLNGAVVFAVFACRPDKQREHRDDGDRWGYAGRGTTAPPLLIAEDFAPGERETYTAAVVAIEGWFGEQDQDSLSEAEIRQLPMT